MPKRHRPSLLVATVLVASVALIAPACGTDTAAPPSSAGAPVKVKIGILPIADVAPIWYGIDKGFFKAENIEVETVPAQGGAAIVPSVMSGEFQFGFSNIVSLLLAREKGVKVELVSNMVNGMGTPDRHGANAVMVAPGRGVASVKDLAGKKIAVNTQKNAGEVTVRATLRNAGVDDSGVSFVEYGFPTMNAVLQQGQVDAIWQAEPFITLGEDAGLEVLVDPMYGTTPNLTIAGVFASEDYLADNADVAARFKRAIARSVTEAARDDAGIRQTIGARTQTPPPVLPRMTLPNWQAEPNVASIELQGKLAEDFGILEAPADTATFVWAPG